MQHFHAIGGLPRSGSTLLCNILAQNPRFHASSTNCVAQTIAGVAAFLSAQDALKSALAHDQDGTERRVVATLRGIIEGWYAETTEPVVIDKSRAWNHNALVLKQLYPDAKLIVLVRDLRSVFASIEKQDRENPSLILNAGTRTMERKAAAMFARNAGMIGAPVCGIEDILRRDPGNIVLIKYESLVAHPRVVLRNLYDSLGEEWFDHDLDNVKPLSTEQDWRWLHKYPHEGSGKVEPRNDKWSDWIAPDIATGIMKSFAAYNGAFGYA